MWIYDKSDKGLLAKSFDFQGTLADEHVLVTTDNHKEFTVVKMTLPEFADNDDLQMNFGYLDIEAAVKVACQFAVNQFGPQNIMVRTSPGRAVFASCKIPKGQLHLVPLTSKVKIVKAEDVVATKNHIDSVLRMKGHGFPENTVVCFSSPPEGINPVWYVQSIDDEQSANAKISIFAFDISTKPSGKGAKGSKTTSISIPIVTNTRTLNRGDPIMLFVKKDAKRSLPAE